MSGFTSSPAPDSAAALSASVVNSYRITAAAEMLALHLRAGPRSDSVEFFNLCFSLSRGIDYALANNQLPPKVEDLPMLIKKICERKNDVCFQAVIMVLMISVKNACKIGWFKEKDSEELLTLANEIGKIYCTMGDVNAGSSSFHSTISTIMERFYPKMKLGPILASIEAKPGYGASVVDFHITKNTALQDKIWLLVAQTDNIETSACLITPQQANFLINGKGVDRRTNVQMDTGPQMPTNVTGMLKYGTNLLQVVGQFNGHYVILVAYMSIASLPEHPVIQDYIQPVVTSIDSDIVEGPSHISLNCPISFTRIKTPVKGRSCKHFQCFDFDNFININSRRPSWRCPHCNQFLCYADIRLDRNVVEIIKEVGDDVSEVIVRSDGSWKALLKNDPNVDKMQNKADNCKMDKTEQQESACSPTTVPDVLDLTTNDDGREKMDSCETIDRKPFQASVHSQSVNPNSTSFGNSLGVNQNVAAQMQDDFWSGVYIAPGRSDTSTVGVSEHPVLTDAVSPAPNQEAEGHGNNPAANSFVPNQFSAPNNLQLQFNYINSEVNEYGRSPSIQSHINRTPVAVQALPVQSQALVSQQSSRTNLNSLISNSCTATPRVSLSNPVAADSSNAILSDAERQQHFTRSPLNLQQVSGVNSSSLQHHSATQNRGPPVNMSAPSQLPNTYRASGSLSELRNPHLQQALNPRTVPINRTSSTMRLSNPQRSHLQQGGSQAGIVHAAGAAANSQQVRALTTGPVARRSPNQTSMAAASSTADNLRGLTGEQRGNVGGTAESVSRPDDLQSEQNWRPTGRMRGSLSGRPFPDAVRQRIIAPTPSAQSSRPQGLQPGQSSRSQGPQPGQSTRPQGPQLVRPPTGGVSPPLDVLFANNRNAYNYPSNT